MTHKTAIATPLPSTGYLRLCQIIGQRAVSEEAAASNRERESGPRKSREAIPALLPISKSSWWQGIQDGRYPPGVKLGPRITAWPVDAIRALLPDQATTGGAK